jgi:hypothetical protein
MRPQTVNFVRVWTRITVYGARSAPSQQQELAKAAELAGYQGQDPWLVPAADHLTVDLVREGSPRSGFHLPRVGDFGGRRAIRKPDHDEVDMLPYGRSSPAAMARHL